MVKVTLVHASWCTVCPSVRKLWQDLKVEYDFEYEEIDVDTPEGQDFIAKHGISGVPTTLIDGEIVFVGVPKKADALSRLA